MCLIAHLLSLILGLEMFSPLEVDLITPYLSPDLPSEVSLQGTHIILGGGWVVSCSLLLASLLTLHRPRKGHLA